jgi:hypothetical protein
MRTILFAALLLAAFTVQSQKPIHAYAVGNWRNGPVVYITPLIQTTEAFTTPQLIARFREQFPEPIEVTDIDVLRYVDSDSGEESRRSLQAKYRMHKLQVVLLGDAEQPRE